MFQNISDAVLLVECKKAVHVEKKATVRVLEYLSEVDKRRLWVSEGYSSLYDFCIRFLNYSVGETNRRIQACRFQDEIQEFKPLLEEGKINLTSLCLLSPHVDSSNVKEILPLVTSKTTDEVEKVIYEKFPESRKKKEFFEAEKDEEIKALLSKAERKASEKDPKTLLKILLKSFVREEKPRPRKVTTKIHTRHVPKHISREVRERDNYQCTFVSKRGVKCNQTAHLQNDHRKPWAIGGSSKDVNDLRTLCRAHNLYMAKINFPTKVPVYGARDGARVRNDGCHIKITSTR